MASVLNPSAGEAFQSRVPVSSVASLEQGFSVELVSLPSPVSFEYSASNFKPLKSCLHMSVLAVVTSVNDVVWEALSYPCIVSHTSTTPSSCQKSNLLFLGAVGTAAV